jgi:hypothetical protein
MTDYANDFCKWCGKSNIAHELQTVSGVRLCKFCSQFPNIKVMFTWMCTVVNYALIGQTVVLGKITYDDETEEYTINYTDHDNINARIGWIT